MTFDVRNLPTPPEGLGGLLGPNYVGNIFYQTDVDLKHQCDQLRTIGDPLATLLRVME